MEPTQRGIGSSNVIINDLLMFCYFNAINLLLTFKWNFTGNSIKFFYELINSRSIFMCVVYVKMYPHLNVVA